MKKTKKTKKTKNPKKTQKNQKNPKKPHWAGLFKTARVFSNPANPIYPFWVLVGA
jgi:hypothetical protein